MLALTPQGSQELRLMLCFELLPTLCQHRLFSWCGITCDGLKAAPEPLKVLLHLKTLSFWSVQHRRRRMTTSMAMVWRVPTFRIQWERLTTDVLIQCFDHTRHQLKSVVVSTRNHGDYRAASSLLGKGKICTPLSFLFFENSHVFRQRVFQLVWLTHSGSCGHHRHH